MAVKVKRGQKQCPKCGAVCGVRSAVCPKCEAKFPVKAKGDKPVKAEKSAKAVKRGRPAKAPVQSLNLVAALGIIGSLKDLTTELGGVEKACTLIDKIDQLADQAGGVEALKDALKTVEGKAVQVQEPVKVVVTKAKAVKVTPAPKAEALKAEEAAPGEGVVSGKVA